MTLNIESQKIHTLLKLTKIQRHKAKGSQLISYYFEKNSKNVDLSNFLKSEIAQTESIKTKVIRLNVTNALQRIIKWLSVNPLPSEGGVFFSGIVRQGNSQEEILDLLTFPNNISLYHCNSSFKIEILEDYLGNSQRYGLVVIERSEASYGYFNGREVIYEETVLSDVRGKHRAGGQSSQRYERGIETSLDQFMQDLGGRVVAYCREHKLEHNFIGGPILTKDEFHQKKYLKEFYPFDGVLSLNNSGQRGLHELAQKAIPLVEESQYSKTNQFIEEFIAHFENKDLYGFGLNGMSRGLTEKRLSRVLVLIENEQKIHYSRCTNCSKKGYYSLETKNCYFCDSYTLSEVEVFSLNDCLSALSSELGFEVMFIKDNNEYFRVVSTNFQGCLYKIAR